MRWYFRSIRTVLFVIPWWIAAWEPPHLLAVDGTPETAAAWILDNIPGINGLVDATAKEVKRTGNPSRIAAFEDVRDVMAHASEWRWYSRDNGILLAIPVRERLGIAARVEGERALADVVRRILNQAGWGNPPVQVVLVAHEEPRSKRQVCRPSEPRPIAVPCVCN